MRPFDFAGDNPAGELERFLTESKKWKPVGYQTADQQGDFDTEMRLRLEYYTDQQERDLRLRLEQRFPDSHKEMTSHMVPLTRHVIDEQARVFVSSSKFDLVAEDGSAMKPDDEIVKWWEDFKRVSGFRNRLKLTNRFTRLLKSSFAKIERCGRKRRIRLYPPHLVNVVCDPADPTNLDAAYGVLFEIGSASGPFATTGGKRYEFWCARPEKPQYAIVSTGGIVERLDGNDNLENPYRDRDGNPIVPVVAFLDQLDEFGLFTLGGQTLHLTNRAVNMALTDIHYIAQAQGWGQMVATAGAGAAPLPGKMVRGPNRIMTFPSGWTVAMINGAPVLGELRNVVDTDVKRASVLSGVPAGAVSLESRTAASGISLLIERQPLTELREEQVDLYQAPVDRLWCVIAAVHNAYAAEDGLPEIPAGVEMRWSPGDLNAPSDPKEKLDNLLVKLANNLTTAGKIIAELDGVSEDEGKQRFLNMQKENAETGASAGAKAPPRAIASFAITDIKQRLQKMDANAPLPTPGQQVAGQPPDQTPA